MAGKLDWTTFKNVIDGKLTSTPTTRHGINPATGEPNPEVPVSTQADVDAAVEAGQRAFKSWSRSSYEDRQKAVLAMADALEKNQGDFAKMLVQEQGKPMFLASMEMKMAVDAMRTTAGFQLEPETVLDNDERQIIVRYTPLGLAVGIVPWNFPVMLGVNKLTPAVMTGNTVLIKPSPFTPYCDLKLVELAQEFFPPGVVQILSGDDNLGPWLTAHPGPAKISFTGSSVTGKKVMESASKTLKRVTLELGGNDPAIVCPDIDVEAVAGKVALNSFANTGQVCVAIKRIFVHESIYEKFRDAMVKATMGLKVGEGNEPGVMIGPVQNSMQFEKVKGFYSEIEKEKWNVAVGGKQDLGRGGYFLEPTIIDNPPMDSKIITEEPFGPIVPLVTWKEEDAVIRDANNTKWGLGASVWSNDLEQARRIGEQIEAGTVWINTHLENSSVAPFGGHKESGIGYEGGVGGLKGYCNAQTIHISKK